MISIQKASFDDCKSIQEVAKISFPATYALILSKEQIDYMMDWMYSTSNIKKQMQEEGHTYYIAWEKNVPLGFVSIQQEAADLFHLQKIYVLPDKQGMHIGEKLFKHAMAEIHAIHPAACTMELNVNRKNKALEFYKKMGMKIQREGDFEIGNNFFMNDYIMGIEIE